MTIQNLSCYSIQTGQFLLPSPASSTDSEKALAQIDCVPCPLEVSDLDKGPLSSRTDIPPPEGELGREVSSVFSQVIPLPCSKKPAEVPQDLIFPSLEPHLRPLLPLQEELQDVALGKVNVYEVDLFSDHLEPNEVYPENGKPYLDQMDPGHIVSAGTERSFFSLALAPRHCQGLIMVDINDRVVAYNRFNILLLMISNTMEEYARLSDRLSSDKEEKNRVDEIRKLAEKSPYLSEKLRSHYLAELENYAKAFFFKNTIEILCKMWRKERKEGVRFGRTLPDRKFFTNVLYFENLELFNKLQHYARSGNIIAKLGNIENLEFLGRLPIGVIDVSNIGDYQLLDLGTKHPIKVIFTQLLPYATRYNFRIAELITEEEKLEIREFFQKYEELILATTPLKMSPSLLQNYVATQWKGAFRRGSEDYTPVFSKQMLEATRRLQQEEQANLMGSD